MLLTDELIYTALVNDFLKMFPKKEYEHVWVSKSPWNNYKCAKVNGIILAFL